MKTRNEANTDIRFHFIKDLCLRKEILIEYISSNQNCADMFTKALGKVKFENFRKCLLNDKFSYLIVFFLC